MTTLVLDTNIVMSAFFWGGNPRRLLVAGYSREVNLVTSQPLILELRTVLSRAKFAERLHESGQSVGELVDAYLRHAASVRPAHTPRLVSDPDDDVVIGTALAAKADFVVTGDHALLAVSEYEGIRIVSATDALRLLAPGR